MQRRNLTYNQWLNLNFLKKTVLLFEKLSCIADAITQHKF